MDNGNSGLTAADVLALTNNNDMAGGNYFWWIIIFFIIAGMFNGNGGMFGNGNNCQGHDIMLSQFSAQNDKFLAMQNQNSINQLNRDLLSTSAMTNQNVMQTNFDTAKEILENRYENAVQTQQLSSQSAQQALTAQAQMAQNALSAQAQLAQCCCDIKQTVHSENEATRNLITQNYIAELQEKLNASQNEVANYQQNQYLLSAIGRYNVVSVPPYNVYPTVYGNYGYGVSTVV